MPHEISALDLFPVREPDSGRAYTVVRVKTRDGTVGWGECGPVSAREHDQATKRVMGLAATAAEPIRRELASLPNLQAAVNMAVLDIAGKLAKAPVYQVLGGPTRNKVRAMTSLTNELERSLDAALGAGFRAYSVPIPATSATNHGQAFVLSVRRRMEALRKAAGAGTDCVLDGGGVLSPGDASTLAAELERFHLLWFDEPCALVNIEAIRKISTETVTPLGFGRSLHQGADFQNLLREQVVDILRPGISRNGISQIRRCSTLAETAYVAVAPYHDGGPIATAAALHLAASLPNFFIQQIPFPASDADRKMRAELTSGSVEEVRDGFASLRNEPGLGIRVNEEALKSYAAA